MTQVKTQRTGRVTVRRLLLAATTVAIAGASAAPAGAAQLVTGNPALYWSSLVATTVTGSPVTTSRSIAMAQLAIYEAANATTGRQYSSYVQADAIGGDTRAAIAVAARNVLVSVNPSRTAEYDAALAASLALVPDGAAKTQGIATGNAIAAATIAKRLGDGSNLTLPYTPQAPGVPGAWQPTPPGNGAAAFPHWQNVTPFVMTSTNQFLSAPPPALDSVQYATDFNEVKDWGGAVSLLRTADQSNSAVVWASTPGVISWQNVAIELAEGAGMSAEDAARMLALLAIGNADTIIALWDTKFEYDFWRPVTAIRNADIDGNAATLADASWTSFVTTPPYPSSSSGIASIASNAQTVLTSFFGDTNNFCIVGAAGQRCFNSFSSAAQAAADARIYGGMHYRFDVNSGLIQGRNVANFTLANALAPVPEPGTWAMLIVGFGLMGASLRRRKRPRIALFDRVVHPKM
ncbi:MAG TPA: PEPxxWA-CTERM sorting domain-containing protein [bacterium]|nr:PEPxxWA-CTERM sorting domain-containing protein [bacterium]